MDLGRGTDKKFINCNKKQGCRPSEGGLWTDRVVDRQTDQHPLMWQVSKLLALTFSLVVSAVVAAPDFAVVIAAAVVAVAVVVAVDGAGVIRLFPVVLKRLTSDFRLPNHKLLLLLPQQQLLRQLCQQSQQRESLGVQQQEL